MYIVTFYYKEKSSVVQHFKNKEDALKSIETVTSKCKNCVSYSCIYATDESPESSFDDMPMIPGITGSPII